MSVRRPCKRRTWQERGGRGGWFKESDYFQNEDTVHLRQFFIDRPFRGRGIGRAAYRHLAEQRFGDREVNLDVLVTNPSGRRFWERLGFTEYFVAMKKT